MSVKSIFLLLKLSLVFITAETGFAHPCSDPMQIIKDFYNSTDSLQFDKSISFFTLDAELTTWAEGVNGRHWQERHFIGDAQIRKALTSRGLRRISDKPNSPIYHESEAKLSPDQASFMLRPDRLSPDHRPYNSYQVIAKFDNCQIKALTVIEYISWE